MSVKQIFLSLIRTINYCSPKNKRKVLLHSFPDFSDNSRALYEYLRKSPDYSDMEFVWVVDNPETMPQEERTRFIKYPYSFGSISYLVYLFHVFTSKYLFTTHKGFIEANRKRQTSVCLWHGTMLKNICAMNPRERVSYKSYDQYSFYTSASDYYVDLYDRSFLCGKQHVRVTGYPRNDMLFEETDILDRLGMGHCKNNKIIVYMPTFKTPSTNDFHDTDADVSEKVLNFSNPTVLAELDRQLSEWSATLIIKWHPLDIHQDSIEGYQNIKSVSNKILQDSFLQFYHILHYADALITDFSSVYCDFLVLDRPMAFDVSDIDTYNDKRGFVFENPVDYLPGYLLKDKNDLMNFVRDIANNIDNSQEKRRSLSSMYNDFMDNKSSERVMNAAINK